MSHAWMQGPVPKLGDIAAEFKQRMQVVHANIEAERK